MIDLDLLNPEEARRIIMAGAEELSQRLKLATDCLTECYWMIKGEDPGAELMAIERRLSRELGG